MLPTWRGCPRRASGQARGRRIFRPIALGKRAIIELEIRIVGDASVSAFADDGKRHIVANGESNGSAGADNGIAFCHGLFEPVSQWLDVDVGVGGQLQIWSVGVDRDVDLREFVELLEKF